MTIRELFAKLRSLVGGVGQDADFQEELQAHVEMAAAELMRQGHSAEEARRLALVRIGGAEQTRELQRDARGLPWLETLMQDTRQALRTLRRDAGFTTFAVLTVALGIGASSTVFNIVNALLLRPLPFRDAERLVWIVAGKGEGLSAATAQVNNLLEFRAQSRSFEDIAGYFAFYGVGDSMMTGVGEPERLTRVPVTENFFPLLGVQPVLGRHFTRQECVDNGPRVALLSHGFWVRRFASDPAIVGRELTLNNQPVTVVGVLPASFDFATVFTPGSQTDLFVPFPLTPRTDRQGNTLALVGRLRPGVSVGQAQAEADVISKQIREANPNRNQLEPTLQVLSERVSGAMRFPMLVLSFAIGVVMLIVCANLSNLLLARSAGRTKEIAIRAALGAGRGRILRQLLTESLVLSLGAAMLGVVLAVFATEALTRIDSLSIPLLQEVRMDGAALGFTLLVAMVTGIAFGLAPAWRLSSPVLHSALKESTRGSTEGSGSAWIRRALVVSEVAFACMLVAAAGLLLRSFTRLLDVDMGFRPQSAVSIRIDPNRSYDTQEKRNGYFDEALARVRNSPGVVAAGLTDSLPLRGSRTWGFAPKGREFRREDYPLGFVRVVSDGYFAAMGVALVAGRDFTPADTATSEKVIIVNEEIAKKMWPGEDALGKIMRTDRPDRRVIGVVRNVRHLALEKESGFEFYLPVRQTNDWGSAMLVVRGSRSAADLAAAVRGALTPLDATLAAAEYRTIQGLVDRAVSPRRFLLLLLAGFAGFALVLAGLGIYAVVSYSVNQRRQEIGIRMALGASAGDVRREVLVQTLQLAGVGLGLGMAAAFVLGCVIEGLLYQVTPGDPMTFGAMLCILAGAAMLAGYLPARRASRMDPMEALRAE